MYVHFRTHFKFFLENPKSVCFQLQSFAGKFKIVIFYKQLAFQVVVVLLKYGSKIHKMYAFGRVDVNLINIKIFSPLSNEYFGTPVNDNKSQSC